MTPPKLHQLLLPLSQRFELPPDVLSQLARAYYGAVQGQLSSLASLNVDVPGLGVFTLKPKALERKNLKISGLLEKVKQRTSLRSFQIAQNLQDDLDQLVSLKERSDAERLRKQEIRQRRYEKAN